MAAGPFKSEIKKVQNDITKINQNMEIMEHSIKKKNIKSRNNLKQVDVRRSE